MSRIWVKVIKKHKAIQSAAVQCTHDDVEERVRDVCREFDVPAPMWLKKQRDEFEQFGLTDFSRDNFFEPISFDKLEINFLPDDGVTHRSKDPRNDFSY